MLVPEKEGKDDHLPEIRGFTDPSRRRYKGRELRMDWSCVQGGTRRNHELNGETCSLQSTPDTRNPNQVLPPTTLLYLIRTGLVFFTFIQISFFQDIIYSCLQSIKCECNKIRKYLSLITIGFFKVKNIIYF